MFRPIMASVTWRKLDICEVPCKISCVVCVVLIIGLSQLSGCRESILSRDMHAGKCWYILYKYLLTYNAKRPWNLHGCHYQCQWHV